MWQLHSAYWLKLCDCRALARQITSREVFILNLREAKLQIRPKLTRKDQVVCVLGIASQVPLSRFAYLYLARGQGLKPPLCMPITTSQVP